MELTFTSKDLNTTALVEKHNLESNRRRYQIDASGIILWKLATIVANIVSGKNKNYYCEMRDCGDYIVIQNVDKMKFTGNKLLQKKYHTYSGYKWNIKTKTLGVMMTKTPEKVLELAVRWMLMKNKLRDSKMKRVKAFAGINNKFDYMKPINISN